MFLCFPQNAAQFIFQQPLVKDYPCKMSPQPPVMGFTWLMVSNTKGLAGTVQSSFRADLEATIDFMKTTDINPRIHKHLTQNSQLIYPAKPNSIKVASNDENKSHPSAV
jgi:hypothetical protein